MPINLDSCITGIFVPGNIGASSGMPPVVRTMPLSEPVITSASTASNLENAVLAHALTTNQAVTWSIVGGADAARFEVSGSTLRWLGNGTKDFETPDDAEADNAYVVTVRAAGATSLTSDQTITVTVTDIDETPPTITSASTASNPENAVLLHTLTADETVTWSIVGGADAARFEVSGSTLRWAGNGVKDFEAPDDADTNNTYIVQVRATDTTSLTSDQTITVTVTDIADYSTVSETATAIDAVSASISGMWELVGSWTYSTNVAQVDFTGLAGYSDVRVLLRGVSSNQTGSLRSLLVSTNNGSSFLSTSGDYIEVDTSGSTTNRNSMFFSSTNGTNPVTAEILIMGWNLTANKAVQHRTRTDIRQGIIPTTSALNALRVSNDLTAGGDFTSGSIYVWAR